jgi:hypothetical protein
MKKIRSILRALSFTALFPLLAAGCSNFFAGNLLPPDAVPVAGSGILIISLTGNNVKPSLEGRTMLPQNPELTKYMLVFTKSDGTLFDPSDVGYKEPYTFYNSSLQLHLPEGSYTIKVQGWMGDKLVAESVTQPVTISSTPQTLPFTLNPVMSSAAARGILSYSLSWDGLTRMPALAELFIESYSAGNVWEPIPAWLPSDLSPGSQPGTILLLNREAAAIKLTGSLELPPGQYRLTMSLTMDPGVPSVSQFDIAHIYSNLTTPAVFHYGSDNILISNTGVDLGPGFITKFTFDECLNATTVIGSVPGTDGTRLIMVMVPSTADLKDLTPKVEISTGAKILSPLHEDAVNPTYSTAYTRGEIDFSGPVVWTVAGRDGAVQKYTVVVSKDGAASSEKRITYFSFVGYPNNPGIIDDDTDTITVSLPYTAPLNLTPVISIIGKSVWYRNVSTDVSITGLNFTNDTPVTYYRVYAGDNSYRDYTVTVGRAADTQALITAFALDGYPDLTTDITDPVNSTTPGTIKITLPYGTSLSNLTPLIQYKGKSIDPGSGTAQNFNVPVVYTVTPNNSDPFYIRKYTVTLSTQPADTDTGIFDFKITNVPYSRVVIGQNPRPDGKIPIVIQVPYGAPENTMIPSITLRSSTSTIAGDSAVKHMVIIPFTNQQAILKVNSQGNTSQEYVVVVSQDVQYYYVNGTTGSDTWPDIYNGGSETSPFKTLAYAVYRASQHTVNKIFVIGTLNNSTEGGAYEEADVPWSAGFHPNGGDPGSVFDLRGTNGKKITITGVGNNATLAGATNKRVISITGGADLIFENITISGGNAKETGLTASHYGNGGGIFISGDSKVKFTGGTITANKAEGSGGGVYIEGDPDTTGTPTVYSGFTLMGGTISGNTATGKSAAFPDLTGGGGVCIVGKALFWMASGSVSGNFAGKSSGTSYGSGGGVLIRASTNAGVNDGFLMSSGSVSNNKSYGNVSPHGGGGVYVATGEFDMQGGEITGNTSVRQGGGVFVHRGGIFTASGTSAIIGNEGVGSSKAICSRGITTLKENAQADKVYVWNVLPDDTEFDYYSSDPNATYIREHYFEFNIGAYARIGGIVLAHPLSFDGVNHSNVINYAPDTDSAGTDQVCRIDLEMNLVNGVLAPVNINAWLGKRIVFNGDNPIPSTRFPMNSLVGKSTMYLTDYELNSTSSAATNGNLKHK